MKRIYNVALAGFAARDRRQPGRDGPGLRADEREDRTVGGAPMYPSKNIIQNAVNSKDHTTLVAAVKAAGLVDTLQGTARSLCSRRPTTPSPSCRPARSKPAQA